MSRYSNTMNCLLLSCYSCRFHLTDAFFSAAYIKALEDSIAVLDKIAMSIDINDRKSISTFVDLESSYNYFGFCLRLY